MFGITYTYESHNFNLMLTIRQSGTDILLKDVTEMKPKNSIGEVKGYICQCV